MLTPKDEKHKSTVSKNLYFYSIDAFISDITSTKFFKHKKVRINLRNGG